MKEENRGYDKDLFIVSRQSKEVALLPGLGKFCLCGCGKRIEGTKVKRKLRNGSIITYDRKAENDKKFATLSCKSKYYMKKGDPRFRLTLQCGITLRRSKLKNLEYRTISLYGKTQTNIAKFILTEANHKSLWEYLNKIEEFRLTKVRSIEPHNQKDLITINDTVKVNKQTNEGKISLAR